MRHKQKDIYAGKQISKRWHFILLLSFSLLLPNCIVAGLSICGGIQYDNAGNSKGYAGLNYVFTLAGGDDLSKKKLIFPIRYDLDVRNIGVGQVFAGRGKLTPILRTRRWSRSLRDDFCRSGAYYAYYSGGVSFNDDSYGVYADTVIQYQLYKYAWVGAEVRYILGMTTDLDGLRVGARFSLRAPGDMVFASPYFYDGY